MLDFELMSFRFFTDVIRAKYFKALDGVLFPPVSHLVKTKRMVVLSDQFLDPDLTESGLAFRFDMVLFYRLNSLIFSG